MWSRFRVRTRLLLGFGSLLLLSAILVATGAGTLAVVQKAFHGITTKIQPANAVAVKGKVQLLETRSAQNAMLAAISDEAAMKDAKASWDAAQASMDQLMTDFAKLVEGDKVKQDNLEVFRTHLMGYRKAFEPVAAKLMQNGYPDAKAARADLKQADAAFGQAVTLLANTETAVLDITKLVFAKVTGIVSTVLTALVVGFAVCLVLGGLIAWSISRSIVARVSSAQISAGRIADGDLSQPIHIEGRDEIAEMGQALERMRSSLSGIVGSVQQASENIQVASTEVATGNQDLSQRTEQTASNLQQAASSMEQLTGTVKQSADSARQANQLAASAAQVAERGGDVVAQVVSTMDEINASSKKISDIIGVIDGIAFQTNILALNAAVEAARAGDQGRGFAVVASEVRSLAQRSAQAAKEIKSLIGTSVDKVETGSRLVADAGTTMNEIVGSVKRVTDIIGEITAASTEQSDGIGQINVAVTQLDQMTQQNAALVEESAAAAEALRDQAVKLSKVVSSFKLDTTRAAPVFAPPPPAAPAKPAPVAPAPAATPPVAARPQPKLKPAKPEPKPTPAPVRAKPIATAAAAPAPSPASAPAAAPLPAPAAAKAADDDWETF